MTSSPGTATADSRFVESYGRGIVLVTAAGLLWSSGGLLFRWVDTASEWQIIVWRTFFLGLSALLYVLWRYRGGVWQAIRSIGWWGLIGGLGLALANTAFIFSLSMTYVANTLLILGVSPFLAALLAWVLLREKVRRATVLSMLIVVPGLVIMVSGGLGTGRVLGDLLALGAVAGFALFSVCIRAGRHGDMMPTVFVAGLISCVVATTVVVAGGDTIWISGHDIGMGFLMGFAQVFLGLTLYIAGSRHLPAAELALLSLTEVVIGPFWVWLVFGEIPVEHTFYGGALVLVAVILNALTGIRRRHPLPQV
ncbi:MAG: DMT family transporter [Pseudomonadota bacterium]